MEEQKKDTEKMENSPKQQPGTTRSTFLLVFAGIYLLYTGYTLCKNVLDGQEDAGWGFFAIGVIFIGIAVFMLFYGLKNYKARTKAEKSEEAAEEPSDEGQACEKSTEASESPDIPAGGMTIAERAKLVSRIGDAKDEEDTE